MSEMLNLVFLCNDADGELASGSMLAAAEISGIFHTSGASMVHVHMCQAQDAAATAESWDLAYRRVKKVLSNKKYGLLFTASRAYNESHRSNKPLFKLQTKAEVDADKQAAAEAAAAEAAAAEAAAAEAAAAEQAEQDKATTPADLVAAVISEADRLGIAREDVLDAMVNFIRAPRPAATDAPKRRRTSRTSRKAA